MNRKDRILRKRTVDISSYADIKRRSYGKNLPSNYFEKIKVNMKIKENLLNPVVYIGPWLNVKESNENVTEISHNSDRIRTQFVNCSNLSNNFDSKEIIKDNELMSYRESGNADSLFSKDTVVLMDVDEDERTTVKSDGRKEFIIESVYSSIDVGKSSENMEVIVEKCLTNHECDQVDYNLTMIKDEENMITLKSNQGVEQIVEEKDSLEEENDLESQMKVKENETNTYLILQTIKSSPSLASKSCKDFEYVRNDCNTSVELSTKAVEDCENNDSLSVVRKSSRIKVQTLKYGGEKEYVSKQNLVPSDEIEDENDRIVKKSNKGKIEFGQNKDSREKETLSQKNINENTLNNEKNVLSSLLMMENNFDISSLASNTFDDSESIQDDRSTSVEQATKIMEDCEKNDSFRIVRKSKRMKMLTIKYRDTSMIVGRSTKKAMVMMENNNIEREYLSDQEVAQDDNKLIMTNIKDEEDIITRKSKKSGLQLAEYKYSQEEEKDLQPQIRINENKNAFLSMHMMENDTDSPSFASNSVDNSESVQKNSNTSVELSSKTIENFENNQSSRIVRKSSRMKVHTVKYGSSSTNKSIEYSKKIKNIDVEYLSKQNVESDDISTRNDIENMEDIITRKSNTGKIQLVQDRDSQEEENESLSQIKVNKNTLNNQKNALSSIPMMENVTDSPLFASNFLGNTNSAKIDHETDVEPSTKISEDCENNEQLNSDKSKLRSHDEVSTTYVRSDEEEKLHRLVDSLGNRDTESYRQLLIIIAERFPKSLLSLAEERKMKHLLKSISRDKNYEESTFKEGNQDERTVDKINRGESTLNIEIFEEDTFRKENKRASTLEKESSEDKVILRKGNFVKNTKKEGYKDCVLKVNSREKLINYKEKNRKLEEVKKSSIGYMNKENEGDIGKRVGPQNTTRKFVNTRSQTKSIKNGGKKSER